MAQFDDYRLDKSETEIDTARGRRRVPTTAIVIALVVLAAAITAYVMWRGRQAAPAQQTAESPARLPDVAPPGAEAGEDIVLPELGATDPVVRELVARLSAHPKVAAWLATDGLIRNFTVVTYNIAQGRTPVRHLSGLGPSDTFRTSGPEEALFLDPASYERYDDYATAISELDARGTARLYATLKPRITEAYRELGYPEGDFDAVLERAIVELLRAPIVEGKVRLTPRVESYAYADQRLESLSTAQKQFLRMGPANVRRVQQKLRELAPYLGIAPERLPQQRVVMADGRAEG
jgi:hypothetical protein